MPLRNLCRSPDSPIWPTPAKKKQTNRIRAPTQSPSFSPHIVFSRCSPSPARAPSAGSQAVAGGRQKKKKKKRTLAGLMEER
ncbi:heat shock protein DnaJ [Musa troglodytarum]|uniref:Heat shock protein DnaJ n=1 Tax=Musa troglodytarum TaxID=320322 RepID=A0A9E7I642_9LILI|nr:heat shock protein DnaJ [Musa troglodytarum]URE46548.1 heat shock protein DnaJ [Musa troglodytarum]